MGGGGTRFVFFVVYHSTGADARVVYHNYDNTTDFFLKTEFFVFKVRLVFFVFKMRLVFTCLSQSCQLVFLKPILCSST